MHCPCCHREISNWALTKAVAHWGGLFYKIFRKESLTKQEFQMMQIQQMQDKDKCFLCRQEPPPIFPKIK